MLFERMRHNFSDCEMLQYYRGGFMDLIDFSRNEDSIIKQDHIESILLYGNPDAIPDAEITICIPTYKRPRLLKEAIESAINQVTDIPYRIIVVDNDPDFGNTEILDLVQSFNQGKLSYYKNKENLMLMGNLNRCVVLAKTNWAALLHDDDLLLDNYVMTISKTLLKYGEKIDGLCNIYEEQNFPFEIMRKTKKNKLYFFLKRTYRNIHKLCLFFRRDIVKIPISANLFFGNIYGPPSCGMIFNREKFVKSGGFNSQYYPSADWFFMIFYAEKYNFYKLKALVTAIYRWGDNVSLKEETLESFKEDRRQCLLSLKKYSLICRFWMSLLKKDYDVIMNSRLEVAIQLSLIYRIVQRIYAFFILPEK
jgi:glycosyltransferase involved in cell wall biosynthesis